MPPATPAPPSCSITLVTPPLSAATAPAFAPVFAEVLAAAKIASARVRFEPGADGDAKAIVAGSGLLAGIRLAGLQQPHSRGSLIQGSGRFHCFPPI